MPTEAEIQHKYNITDDNSYFANLARERAAQYAHVISMLGMYNDLQQAPSFLDVGARDGGAIETLQLHFPTAEYTAVDIVPEFIARLEDVCDNAVCADFIDFALEADDEAFDYTFTSHMLEHVKNPYAHVDELLRITKYLTFIVVPMEGRKAFEGNPSHHFSTTQASEWLEMFKDGDFMPISFIDNSLTGRPDLIYVAARKDKFVEQLAGVYGG